MATINVDKDIVQGRLNKYFDSFRSEQINGVNFDTMPLREEVPLIKQVSYNPEKDIFEVVFDYQERVIPKKTGNVVFIEDTQNHLVGVQIIQIQERGVKEITLEVITNLDKVIQTARIKQNPSIQELADLDIEQRKVDFFKEVVREDLPTLIHS